MAVVGSTGAGKDPCVPDSRYHAASEGQILIDGHDVNDVTIESLRGQMSYVFQPIASTVAVADHVVFLDEGRVLEEGTHTELMVREDGNYRRFVDLQTSPVD